MNAAQLALIYVKILLKSIKNAKKGRYFPSKLYSTSVKTRYWAIRSRIDNSKNRNMMANIT